tara:strand:+ start:345 stop:464 length:120 start_codon:yes stop_codon:yes gene_type:complete
MVISGANTAFRADAGLYQEDNSHKFAHSKKLEKFSGYAE